MADRSLRTGQDACAPRRRGNLSARVLLLTMATYMALGNIARFIPFYGAASNILVTEIVFYAVGLAYLAANAGRIRIPVEIIVLATVLILSTAVGALKFGVDAPSFLYAARFAILFFVCFGAGEALQRLYGGNLAFAVGWYILLPFVISGLIGWVLYFVFPNAGDLWFFLSLYDIKFQGDAHTRRLLSSYFDPNLFCPICVFALSISHALYTSTRKMLFLAADAFFVICAFFTISRSGLATLMLFIAVLCVLNIRKFRLGKKSVILFIFLVTCLAGSYPLYQEALMRALDRFQTNIALDVSSLDRIYSARRALAGFSENPLLGIGFNYIGIYSRGEWKLFDSSVLTVLSTMGSVFGTIFAAALVVFAARALRRAYRAATADVFTHELVRNLTVCLAASLMFTSNFNNLLFFQFWVVPVLTLISYLYAAYRQPSVDTERLAIIPRQQTA